MNTRKKRTILTTLALGTLITATAYAATFAEDVIVQGSECVGMDCATGEVFDYDTFRLKENNLRIHFDDTSAAGSFPGNDWRLIANDAANGGANYFAIEDSTAGTVPFRVLAGAGNNALYVNSNGNVGIGTSSPAVDTHITSGNSPTVRLEQDGSGGWTPQSWDIAGNETNFFVRDVTNGSNLPFKIKPGAPTGSLVVAADGSIGMGTESPAAQLHVSKNKGASDYNPSLTLQNTGSNGFVGLRLLSTAAAIDFNNSNGKFRINWDDGDNFELNLDADGNLTIDGNLVANGSTFPDYVFDEDYQLMSLADVDSYIKKHGHLPNVPSAEDVAKHGVNMTQMQKLLVEKVEELTLHAIRLNETATEQQELIESQGQALHEQQLALEAQEARIDALEAKLEKLIAQK